MTNIRLIGAAIGIMALALTAASARTCDAQGTACKPDQAKSQSAPLRLSQFLTPGGAAPTKHRNTHAQSSTHAQAGKPHSRMAAKAASRPVIADADTPPKTNVATDAAELSPPPRRSETDGVAVASSDEVNEIDTAADTVTVVAANEVNEIDLAADAAPAPVQAVAAVQDNVATVQTSPPPPPADRAWIWEVFAALGGILAVASAARLLIV